MKWFRRKNKLKEKNQATGAKKDKIVDSLSVQYDLAQDREMSPKKEPATAALPPIYINIGLDYGTSYSKVCYRLVGHERTGVVSFSMQDNDHAYYVPCISKINCAGDIYVPDLESNGEIDDDVVILKYCKMAAAGDLRCRKQNSIIERADITEQEMYTAVCVFFLAKLLDRTRQAVVELEMDTIGDRSIQWSVNMGVPIDYLDSAVRERFSLMLKAAWALSLNPEPISNASTIAFMLNTLSQSDRARDCHVIPELAAGVTPFALASGTPDGIYTVFDIGSGSMDGATFELSRTGGYPKINFLTSKVEMLGLDWISQRISASFNKDVTGDIIKKYLTTKNGFKHLPSNVLNRVALEIHRYVSEVIVNAKQADSRSWKNTMTELPMFIGGGGGASYWHRHEIFRTYSENKLQNAGIPPYREWGIPIPDNISLNGLPENNFYRFLIAYGLSLPKDEGPMIVGFPTQNPRISKVHESKKDKLYDMQWEKYGEV
jgi:hypothetical protein